MEFKDKYISNKENSVKPDAKKMVLSDDAYAISEMINVLIQRIEKARRALV